jgi:hypothetical protein
MANVISPHNTNVDNQDRSKSVKFSIQSFTSAQLNGADVVAIVMVLFGPALVTIDIPVPAKIFVHR